MSNEVIVQETVTEITVSETTNDIVVQETVSEITLDTQTIIIPQGPAGATGATGPQGDPGEGVPTGGLTGQFLTKASNADFDTTWVTQNAAVWGNITGTISAQTDLQNALNAKYDASNPAGYITSAGAPVQSVAGKTGAVTLDKSDVGLGNVDNTSDLNKPISTATQTALDGKQATLVSGTNIKTVNGNSLLGSGDVVIGGSAAWGSITGTLSSQTDLQSALDAKANLSGATFAGNVSVGSNTLTAGIVQAPSSAGGTIRSNSGSVCMDWGAGGGQNVTFEDGVKLNARTASQILATDANKNIQTLDTATYPSLTELSYVKGVTSAIQTQLDGKQASGSYAAASHTHVAADVMDFSEAVDDRVSTLLVAGANITLTYNDFANTLTVASTSGSSVNIGMVHAISSQLVTQGFN